MVAVAVVLALTVGVVATLVVFRDEGDEAVSNEGGLRNDRTDQIGAISTDPLSTAVPLSGSDPSDGAPLISTSPTVPQTTTPTTHGAPSDTGSVPAPVGTGSGSPEASRVVMPTGCYEQGDTPPSGHVPHPSDYAATSFTDADHLVTLAVPSTLATSRAFDGSVAEWSDGNLTLTYQVHHGIGVAEAIDHFEELCAIGRLAGSRVTYSPRPHENTLVDGRYVVARHHGGNRYSYERGRVRCGAPVMARCP